MDTHLTEKISKATTIAKVFITWNVAFFIAALLLKNTIASDAVGSVFLRGGFYALGGLILIYLLKQMAQGKRSGWLRLSIISVLAPLGAVAFVVFTPHLPVWFDIAQLGGALLLASIATLVLEKDVRKQFRKTSKG